MLDVDVFYIGCGGHRFVLIWVWRTSVSSNLGVADNCSSRIGCFGQQSVLHWVVVPMLVVLEKFLVRVRGVVR